MPEPERRVTVESLAREYFEQHLDEEVTQQEVTSWIIDRYEEAKGRRPQDPWRTVRRLAQDGWLIHHMEAGERARSRLRGCLKGGAGG